MRSLSVEWQHMCSVERIDEQVPICGRYSCGTTNLQKPGEVASVKGIALVLRRA